MGAARSMSALTSAIARVWSGVSRCGNERSNSPIQAWSASFGWVMPGFADRAASMATQLRRRGRRSPLPPPPPHPPSPPPPQMKKRRLARAALTAQRPLLARGEDKSRHPHNLHLTAFRRGE